MGEDNKEYKFLAVVLEGDETADEALKKVQKLKKSDTFTLEDVVAVHKNEKGKVKLKQGRGLTGTKGTLGFGTAGLVAGTIFGGPLVGAAIGAAIGGASSQINKVFGNDEMKELGESLDQDSSMLVLLVSDMEEGALETLSAEFGAEVHAFMIAEEGLVAMGAVTENESFLAVMDEESTFIAMEETVELDGEEEVQCDDCGTKEETKEVETEESEEKKCTNC
ncbi:MAG: DUF1269 domain-containing protein [Patescibacteria group bacterium]|nr:DUF1269 domain-containing protein [Patescibacteria group bacterium]